MRTSHRACLGIAAGIAALALAGCGTLIPDNNSSADPFLNPDSKFPVAATETRQPVLTGAFLKGSEVGQAPKQVGLSDVTEVALSEGHGGLRAGIHLCTITLVVDEQGRPTQVQWTSSNSGAYAKRMLAEVQHMTFQPALLNGKAVACEIQMNFKTEIDEMYPYVMSSTNPSTDSGPTNTGPINGYYRP